MHACQRAGSADSSNICATPLTESSYRCPAFDLRQLGMMESASLLLGLIGCVVVYVVLAAIRAVFFPASPPKPLEYKPRQVRNPALFAPPSRRRLHKGLSALSSIPVGRSGHLKASWTATMSPAAASHAAVGNAHCLERAAQLSAWPLHPFVPAPPSCQVGDLTLTELSKYTGHDPSRPILLAVRGRVFDVTMGRAFYGPGAPLSRLLLLGCFGQLTTVEGALAG